MTGFFTLWLFNIAMENGPFIVGLPSYKMVIFHGYGTNKQMVAHKLQLTNHESFPPAPFYVRGPQGPFTKS